MIQKITNLDQYREEYLKSVEDPAQFWAEQARTFSWKKPWHTVLQGDFTEVNVKWFEGATLNITENCLDRFLPERANQPAIIWEPNDPKEVGRTLTYLELYESVAQLSHTLQGLGVEKGDRVCIYMPMVPEAAIAMLACARVGAIHSIVFGGFSATSLADRLQDAQAKLLITSDGGFRGAKSIDLKGIADEAMAMSPSVTTCLVLQRTKEKVVMKEGRDLWWHEAIAGKPTTHQAVEMEAEDPLFILYTSGSTGKPKGVVHSTAGYMVYAAYSFTQVFQYEERDVYWCTADVGWITGHSYLVYGPLLSGATTLFFEGIPTFPDAGRFWDVVDKHQVNIFYTAPTAIRSLMAMGDEWVMKHDLSSLKVLGSVGEPINEEAWHWYHEKVGRGNCPVTDTWWQTETGGIMIAPIPHVTPTKPAFATLPLPGIVPIIVNQEGKELLGNEVEGNLCIKTPWPSMIRTTYGDHERCKQTYFSTYKGLYFTGDGCKRDADGYYRILGRVDDVINVSGHRLGTAEVESAINEHNQVVESAVVGYPHDIKGQGIYAFVICEPSSENPDQTKKEILAVVQKIIGPIAKPDKIQLVSGLPKTRSGKIMRRILRKIAEGDTQNLGDTSTLLDPNVVEEIKNGAL